MKHVWAFVDEAVASFCCYVVTTFSFAMFQGGFVSWFLFYVTVPFLLYSFCAFVVAERVVAVERMIEPSYVEVGEDVAITVRVKRKTYFPFIYVTIGEVSQRLQFVGFKRQFVWQYTMQQMPRGVHDLEQLEVTFHDFFGWVCKRFVVDDEQTVVVYPRIQDINMPTLWNSGSMLAKQSLNQDTTMVTSIRNYQAGDRVSWIHWKSFAKSQVLYTKDFEGFKSQELLLLLDRSASNHFDEAVELVASMIHAIVKKRGNVCFKSIGEERGHFPTVQMGNQLDRIMYYLAKVETDQQLDGSVLVATELDRAQGEMVLIVTADMTEQKLKALDQVGKPCICFVVGMDELPRYKGRYVRLVAVPKGEFTNVFAGVIKS